MGWTKRKGWETRRKRWRSTIFTCCTTVREPRDLALPSPTRGSPLNVVPRGQQLVVEFKGISTLDDNRFCLAPGIYLYIISTGSRHTLACSTITAGLVSYQNPKWTLKAKIAVGSPYVCQPYLVLITTAVVTGRVAINRLFFNLTWRVDTTWVARADQLSDFF